jgi:DNA polymerase I-like protein with 3'-5' exonuclease and polymerase domains
MTNFIVPKSLSELPAFNPELPVFCDSETDGFYINTRLVQLYQPEASDLIFVLDTDVVDLEEIKVLLKPLWTVWHNTSYDFGTLKIVTAKFDDTLWLARIAYPEWGEYGLDKVIAKLGHMHLYDGIDKKGMQKSGFKKGAYLSNAQLRYSATDVYALSLIWQNKQFQRCREVMAYKIDILSIKYSIQYQQNGLVVDQASVRKELDDIADKILANEIDLQGLNPNSPKQCKEALGTEATDKNTLIHLITEGNKTAELIFNQRRLLKRRTFLHSYNFPKVFTHFNPNGTVTGRFSASGGDHPRGINAQQITRNLQYLFNQNTEDTTVIHADFSTAELRAGCSIMKDEQMYKELMAGTDLHKIAATLAMGGKPEDVSKADRQKGKAISFGFIFGMSAPSFQEYAYVNYGVIFTPEECVAIKKAYTDRYKSINKYHKEKWNSYKTEPVTTPLGHRAKARLGTDAINHATQGCIAETTKLAVHYLVKEDEKALVYIFNVVHDALYLRVPNTEVDYWVPKILSNMKKGWSEMCKTPLLYYKDIPMPVELEYTCPISGKHIVIEE